MMGDRLPIMLPLVSGEVEIAFVIRILRRPPGAAPPTYYSFLSWRIAATNTE
jgi:hypothetical protein